jgi:hypothetical protein
MGCKVGEIHLKNPNTGAIICVKQSDVQKYVKEGWVALDKIPGMKESTSDCKGGEIKLQNPDTGTIICEKPSDAKKFVKQGWIPSHSPLKQFSSGVAPHDVVCRGDFVLTIRDSGHANCMKITSHDKLVAHGLILKLAVKDCKVGEIHLKNPNTGAIICENQSKAPKYVNQGWVAIDKIPGMETTTPTICKGGEVKLKNPSTGTIICENQDQAQKYIDQGWTRAEPMTATVQSSKIVSGENMHKHMPRIETIDVTRESVDSNAYHVTYKVTAGDQSLENITILVVSDNDKVTGKLSSVAAREDATLQIRIHAIDAGSIHGSISNYHPE